MLGTIYCVQVVLQNTFVVINVGHG